MLDNFSADLQKIRESKNLTLKDISEQTKLHIAFIENLEKGNFDFQPQTYIRAFLKQYAKAVGIDPERILHDYDLAKSGKYVSQFKDEKEENASPVEAKDEIQETDELKKDVTEKSPAIAEKREDLFEVKRKPLFDTGKREDTKEIEEKIKKASDDKVKEEASISEKKELSGKKEKVKSEETEDKDEKKFRREHFITSGNRTKPESKETKIEKEKSEKVKTSPSFKLSSAAVKNILTVLFVLILLFGLYALISIFLKDNGSEGPEIKRQSFSDIVKEQEQKILGKKSEEEIQDSIRQAEEERRLAQEQLDSITLKIISIAPGSMEVAVDSSGMKKPEKIEFGNNEIGVFKAKNFFLLTTENSSSIKVTLNDKPVEFRSRKLEKLKITRDGISQ